jgi:hypothetical protein
VPPRILRSADFYVFNRDTDKSRKSQRNFVDNSRSSFGTIQGIEAYFKIVSNPKPNATTIYVFVVEEGMPTNHVLYLSWPIFHYSYPHITTMTTGKITNKTLVAEFPLLLKEDTITDDSILLYLNLKHHNEGCIDNETIRPVETENATIEFDSHSSSSVDTSSSTSHDGYAVESELDNSTSEEFDTGLNMDDQYSEDEQQIVARGEHVDPNDSATVLTSHETKQESLVKEMRTMSIPVSIMKVKSRPGPLFINNSRRRWKSLPATDLNKILTATKSQIDTSNRNNPEEVDSQLQHPLRRNSVSFDSIRIRFYSQTLGDNPSVSYGPPIQLDWDYEEQGDIQIDEYERNHPKRRNLKQLVMSYYHRRNLLSWQYGVSDADLKKATEEADKIKLRRNITKTLLPLMTFESALERASRRARQIVRAK